MESPLSQAVDQLAQALHAVSDTDLGQPWQWRAHGEGVRFGLLGTYHELRDLAVRLGGQRAQHGPPRTQAQRALAPYHAAYRDLLAVLLGVGEELYDERPAGGEWPLRDVVAHIVAADRTFFTLVHYGVRRQREGGDLSAELPEGEVARIVGARDEFRVLAEEGAPDAVLAHYRDIHQRALDEFAGITDQELAGPSVWWEGEPYDLQYRLHRFDAHLRQHTAQAEKVLAALGRPLNEATRLLRLVYGALADVESVLLGAPELLRAERDELAETIAARAAELPAVLERAHEMQGAVAAGDVEQVEALLAEDAGLANCRAESGLPLLLQAVYQRNQPVAEALAAARSRLSIFEAAALGRLEAVQAHVAEWPGWVHEPGPDGFTPLHLAAFFGREEVALWLLAHEADANALAANEQQLRPLHAAAANGSKVIMAALLEAGADVNAAQQGGFTALHTAGHHGDVAMAQLLLKHGADPTLRSDAEQTPLQMAEAAGHAALAPLLRPDAN